MGRWLQVKCSCPNRTPAPGSDAFDEPYRSRGHLTTMQAREAQYWRDNTFGKFLCGHRDGLVLEMAPHDVLTVSAALDRALRSEAESFPLLRRLHDPSNYTDETLPVTPAQASVLIREVELLEERLLQLPADQGEFHRLWRACLSRFKTSDGDVARAFEALRAACAASASTGNPVEFLW